MRSSVPLIRAGCLAPLVKWLEQRGRAVDAALAQAGVACDPVSTPDLLIPLRAAFSVYRAVSEAEKCPDLGWRVVERSSLHDLGLFGLLILSEPTPAAALRRASREIGSFCSHEVLEFEEAADGTGVMTIRFNLSIDPLSLHQGQLFSLAMVRSVLVFASGAGADLFRSIRIPPHPALGLSHLNPFVARIAEPAQDDRLVMIIPPAVLHAPFRGPAPPRVGPPRGEVWERLAGAHLGFTAVIRHQITGAMGAGTPSAQVLAENAGVTLRTLQRRLAADGTSFRDLVDEARRELALAEIAGGSAPIGSIAEGLGYSGPAALSRAVRRWTRASPRALRRGEPADR